MRTFCIVGGDIQFSLSIRVSIHLSIHPSIHPSIYLSIYLYIYLSLSLSIYLSTLFHNSCRHLPQTKLHSSLFLHWSGSQFLVAMAACTPSIHVFLGRPLFSLSGGVHSIINFGSKMPNLFKIRCKLWAFDMRTFRIVGCDIQFNTGNNNIEGEDLLRVHTNACNTFILLTATVTERNYTTAVLWPQYLANYSHDLSAPGVRISPYNRPLPVSVMKLVGQHKSINLQKVS